MSSSRLYAISFFKSLGLALLIITFHGCYPEGGMEFGELDIVATDYDPEYFATTSPTTYHLPDTVGLIGLVPHADPQLTREQMDFILAQVERNFHELGYQRIDSIDIVNGVELPEVGVNVNALLRVGCISKSPWWGWDSSYPEWARGPGYCYPSYAYSYEKGTLVIEMVSPEQFTIDTFNRVWEAGINGLIRNYQAGNEAFVKNNIDKAFQQSPYLRSDFRID